MTTMYVSRASRVGPSERPTRQPVTADATLRFRPDIEGLRAVAVVLVVLYHAGAKWLGGGYVGVDVFFVISGFLITTQLHTELAIRRTISIAGFYARRATRLLPASTLVLVATVVGAWLWLPPTRLQAISLDALVSAGYGINWRLAAQGVDYLSAGVPPSPLQHFWSLAVEEQFYLVWPLLLVASSLAWRRRRPAPSRASIVVVLVALCAGSLAVSVTQTRAAAPWAYFGAHTRAWELAIGALIAIVVPSLAALPKVLAAALTWLGLAAILSAAVLYTDATPFPGYAAALPVAGAGLIIAGGCAAPAAGVVGLFRHGACQLIGKLSYGWYLWHWPVLMIVPVALGITRNLGLNLALGAVSLGLAAVSFRYVENPVRSVRRWKARPRLGISLGLSFSACAAGVALIGSQVTVTLPGKQVSVALPDSQVAATTGPDRPTPAPGSTRPPLTAPEQELAGLLQNAVKTTVPPANLRPTLPNAVKDSPIVYPDGCHLAFTAVIPKKSCVYGDTTAPTKVVLFGDSHAAQWFPALDQLAKARHWRLLSMTKSACPAASVLVYQDALKRAYTECAQWRDNALATIKAMHPAMVVLTNNGTDSGGLVNAGADPDRTWVDGWTTTLGKVSQAGTKLVFLSDTPFPKSNVPDCVSTNLTDVTRCLQTVRDGLVQPTRRRLVAAAAAQAGATVIDPTPWLCTETTCPVIVGNLLVYKDDSHLTAEYSKFLTPVLAARLP